MEDGEEALVCIARTLKCNLAGAGVDVGVELAEVEVNEEVSVCLSAAVLGAM